MSHSRRHEKKEWIKTLQKLCNKNIVGKHRKKLEKELEVHEAKFHEYAAKWVNNPEHKAHREKMIRENETFVDVISELWLLFSKYIIGGVMTKEGYFSLKTRIHYAMLPMRGSDAMLMEERCIRADWEIDNKAFSPLDNDNFHLMMYDTLEAWIDVEHDTNYVSAFTFNLFLAIADTTHSPPKLVPLRLVRCIKELKEVQILKNFIQSKEIRAAIRKHHNNNNREIESEQRIRARRNAVVYPEVKDRDVLEVAIQGIKNEEYYSESEEEEEKEKEQNNAIVSSLISRRRKAVYHRRRTTVRRMSVVTGEWEDVEVEETVDENGNTVSLMDDDGGILYDIGEADYDIEEMWARVDPDAWKTGGDFRFGSVGSPSSMSASRLGAGSTAEAGVGTGTGTGTSGVAGEYDLVTEIEKEWREKEVRDKLHQATLTAGIAEQQRRDLAKGHRGERVKLTGAQMERLGFPPPRTRSHLPPVEEKDYNETYLDNRGRWLEGHGWMVPGAHGDWVYHGYGADYHLETRERHNQREECVKAFADDILDELIGDILHDAMNEVKYAGDIAAARAKPMSDMLQALGLRGPKASRKGCGDDGGGGEGPFQKTASSPWKPIVHVYPSDMEAVEMTTVTARIKSHRADHLPTPGMHHWVARRAENHHDDFSVHLSPRPLDEVTEIPKLHGHQMKLRGKWRLGRGTSQGFRRKRAMSADDDDDTMCTFSDTSLASEFTHAYFYKHRAGKRLYSSIVPRDHPTQKRSSEDWLLEDGPHRENRMHYGHNALPTPNATPIPITAGFYTPIALDDPRRDPKRRPTHNTREVALQGPLVTALMERRMKMQSRSTVRAKGIRDAGVVPEHVQTSQPAGLSNGSVESIDGASAGAVRTFLTDAAHVSQTLMSESVTESDVDIGVNGSQLIGLKESAHQYEEEEEKSEGSAEIGGVMLGGSLVHTESGSAEHTSHLEKDDIVSGLLSPARNMTTNTTAQSSPHNTASRGFFENSVDTIDLCKAGLVLEDYSRISEGMGDGDGLGGNLVTRSAAAGILEDLRGQMPDVDHHVNRIDNNTAHVDNVVDTEQSVIDTTDMPDLQARRLGPPYSTLQPDRDRASPTSHISHMSGHQSSVDFSRAVPSVSYPNQRPPNFDVDNLDAVTAGTALSVRNALTELQPRSLLAAPGVAAISPIRRPKSGVYPSSEVQREGIRPRFVPQVHRQDRVEHLQRLRPLSADARLHVDTRVGRLQNLLDVIEHMPYTPSNKHGKHLRYSDSERMASRPCSGRSELGWTRPFEPFQELPSPKARLSDDAEMVRALQDVQDDDSFRLQLRREVEALRSESEVTMANARQRPMSAVEARRVRVCTDEELELNHNPNPNPNPNPNRGYDVHIIHDPNLDALVELEEESVGSIGGASLVSLVSHRSARPESAPARTVTHAAVPESDPDGDRCVGDVELEVDGTRAVEQDKRMKEEEVENMQITMTDDSTIMAATTTAAAAIIVQEQEQRQSAVPISSPGHTENCAAMPKQITSSTETVSKKTNNNEAESHVGADGELARFLKASFVSQEMLMSSLPQATFAFTLDARAPDPACGLPGGRLPAADDRRGWEDRRILRDSGNSDAPKFDVSGYRQSFHRVETRRQDLEESALLSTRWFDGLPEGTIGQRSIACKPQRLHTGRQGHELAASNQEASRLVQASVDALRQDKGTKKGGKGKGDSCATEAGSEKDVNKRKVGSENKIPPVASLSDDPRLRVYRGGNGRSVYDKSHRCPAAQISRSCARLPGAFPQISKTRARGTSGNNPRLSTASSIPEVGGRRGRLLTPKSIITFGAEH